MANQPMPEGIVPMLAKPGQMPDNDGDYGFEMKWDGIRAILYLDRGRGRLASRNLLDITRQYPETQLLAEEQGASRLVLDGEIVALDEDGRPSFGRLQNRMGVASDQAVRQLMVTTPVTYMIFDLLYRDGASLMSEPYARRRDLLKEMKLSGKACQTPDHVAGNGPAVQAVSRRLGLEGVVAKHLDSPYQPGKRTGAWLKIKNQMRQEMVIGGWLPGSGARSGRIGALMVGYGVMPGAADSGPARDGRGYDGSEGVRHGRSQDEDERSRDGRGYDEHGSRHEGRERIRDGCSQEQRLVYAGKVGTGFSDQTLDKLAAVLQPLRRADSPFCPDPGLRGAVFVEPRLVCEVEFTQWTAHGTLRHPSFKGLREDKNPREVVRET